jgi:hypothetical protein
MVSLIPPWFDRLDKTGNALLRMTMASSLPEPAPQERPVLRPLSWENLPPAGPELVVGGDPRCGASMFYREDSRISKLLTRGSVESLIPRRTFD